MALEQKTIIDLVQIDRYGNVHVREAKLVLQDGEEIAKTYHRYVRGFGIDVSDQPQFVIDIAHAAWRDPNIAQRAAEVKAAEDARRSEIEAKMKQAAEAEAASRAQKDTAAAERIQEIAKAAAQEVMRDSSTGTI